MRIRGGQTVLALLLGLIAAPAHADLVLDPAGTPLTITRHRVLLIHSDRNLTLLDELHLENTARRALWIKPFSVEGRIEPQTESPFDALHAATKVEEPYNNTVRRSVFGPSVVTLLTNKLITPRVDASATDAPPSPQNTVDIVETRFFSGPVYTSTITKAHLLPSDMQEWLRGQGFTLDERKKATIGLHLNQGWSVMLGLLEINEPGPVRVGPLRIDIETPKASYPLLRKDRAGGRPIVHEFYVVGRQPLVAQAYPTVWDEQPWQLRTLERGVFRTTYNRPIDPIGPIYLELATRKGLPLPARAHLVTSTFRPADESWGEVEFEPAIQSVEIPGTSARGLGLDLFLCILLGLTPLIYTPESWFLLWVAARAREKVRRGDTVYGHKLWPLYAILVAGYWFFQMEGAARLAAVIPFLVGMFQLILPYTDRERPLVRSKFAKKKAEN